MFSPAPKASIREKSLALALHMVWNTMESLSTEQEQMYYISGCVFFGTHLFQVSLNGSKNHKGETNQGNGTVFSEHSNTGHLVFFPIF